MTEPPADSMKAQVAELLAELGTRLLPSIHVVNFYGMVQVPVSIRAKVVRMAVEPSATTLVQVE
jgi:hypothetical protein